MAKMKNTKIKTENNIKLDSDLFSYIQTAGGVSFKEPVHIVEGDGYIKPVHIYSLPSLVSEFWLDNILNIEHTIATLDVHTKNRYEAKKNINRSLKTEKAIYNTANNYLDIYDAQKRYDELEDLYHEISTLGEVVKECDFRVFIPSKKIVQLEEEYEKITKKLDSDSYKSAVFLNEMKREYESIFLGFQKQRTGLFNLEPQPLTSNQLAAGDPFAYSELIDQTGDFLGFTDSDGVVIFDEFTSSSKRKHYNSLVIGDMGSGKSTLLKKRFTYNAVRGNFIRTFDVSGEFEKLTKEFGGKIIKCSGSEGTLNPLEILKASDNDDTSYARHIAKVKTFFTCITPQIEDSILIALETTLREFYAGKNLVPGNIKITGLSSKKYPIFSDFLFFIDEKLEKLKIVKTEDKATEVLVASETLQLSHLRSIVDTLVKNYGQMFDRHTSIDNITDEKIVTFDISDIKDLGNVFVAQMFNMVTLCWDNAVSSGQIMKDMYEQENLEDYLLDKFLIVVDEAHRWINTNMLELLEQLVKYSREGRKYFAGMLLATQSIADFIGNSNEKGVELLKALFSFMQYKFIFKQDASATDIIKDTFKDSLTYSQLEDIPYLERGECILAIAGDRTIRFDVWASSEYELPIFAGGK